MIFILASYTTFLIYLYLGFHVYKINPKGAFNRLFVAVCAMFACCSMMELVKYIVYDNNSVYLIDQLSKIIWMNYPAVVLDITLYITRKDWHAKIGKKKYMMYIPGAFFTIFELLILNFLIKAPIVSKIFFVTEWASLYVYISACIYLFWSWNRKTKLATEKKHIRSALIYGVLAVVLAAVNDFALAPKNKFLLSLDQFIIFFFFVGAVYMNYKYKFFELSSLVTAENILDKIMEMVLLVDMEGCITGANLRVEKMLGYDKDRLIGSRLEDMTNIDFSDLLERLNFDGSYMDDREWYCMSSMGSKIPVSIKVSAVKGKNNETAGFIIIMNDKTLVSKLQNEISERVKKESQLNYLSMHDSLTGLYNRMHFNQTIYRLQAEHCIPLGIIMCDLDGLKLINDTFGHDKGDRLLIDGANTIKSALDGKAILSRIGGDEFAILSPACTEEGLNAMCAGIRGAVDEYNAGNPCILLSVSMGYSLRGSLSKSMNEVLKEADNNMYREKLYNTHSFRSTMVQALMRTLEARDFITEGHADRMGEMAVKLGGYLGLSGQRILDLQLLAQFHDLGKVGIPDVILFKPSSLTGDEILQMQRHSEIGFKIAQVHPDLNNISDLILKHHERWDGKGYPLGIREEEIPLECRILAIIDAYDAMVNDRPYRKAMSRHEAVAELKKHSGTQFDPRLVPEFIKMIG